MSTRDGVDPTAADAADWVATDLAATGLGMAFRLWRAGREVGRCQLALPGRYNVENALVALAAAAEFDADLAVTTAALATFRGIERRFQLRGTAGGVSVYDDYAHHPSEVRAALAAARAAHPGRVVAVFQPHRYTRTRDCFEGFKAAFDDAGLVAVSEVYAAGEAPIDGFGGDRLAAAIRAHGHPHAQFLGDLDAVAKALPQQLRAGDLVLTLGAGDVSALGDRLLTSLEEGAQ